MSLQFLLRAVGLDELDLWDDDPVTRLQANIARLESRLQQRYALLVRQRRAIERLRHDLPLREQAYQERLQDVHQLQHRLARLREKLQRLL